MDLQIYPFLIPSPHERQQKKSLRLCLLGLLLEPPDHGRLPLHCERVGQVHVQPHDPGAVDLLGGVPLGEPEVEDRLGAHQATRLRVERLAADEVCVVHVESEHGALGRAVDAVEDVLVREAGDHVGVVVPDLEHGVLGALGPERLREVAVDGPGQILDQVLLRVCDRFFIAHVGGLIKVEVLLIVDVFDSGIVLARSVGHGERERGLVVLNLSPHRLSSSSTFGNAQIANRDPI